MVYPTIGIDGKRYKKIWKDSGCIVERRFLCDVASAQVLLNRGFPYLWGSWLVSDLLLGFVSVFVFELSAVYVPITRVFNMNHVKIGAV